MAKSIKMPAWAEPQVVKQTNDFLILMGKEFRLKGLKKSNIDEFKSYLVDVCTVSEASILKELFLAAKEILYCHIRVLHPEVDKWEGFQTDWESNRIIELTKEDCEENSFYEEFHEMLHSLFRND